MYKIVILLVLSTLLFACSEDGKLKVINRTAHEVYFSIEGDDYTVAGTDDPEEPLYISVKLDAGSDFLNTPRKTYPLSITGETFAIYNDDQQEIITETVITIKGDETTKVYCDPNFACLRIYNDSELDILKAYYTKSYVGNPILITEAENLPAGESIYKRLQYSLEIAQEPEDIFYYTFQVVMQDSTIYNFGDESTILHLDDLYEINIQ
ncbi:MAG: hypothetical protein K9M99_00610 [Candidatus Cloacimonetes bacterium]|nr:hypothetical protein [Candidatus Cloacimonadota bacterium]